VGVCEEETVNKGFPTKGKLGGAAQEEEEPLSALLLITSSKLSVAHTNTDFLV
jgi:hypothetical protein